MASNPPSSPSPGKPADPRDDAFIREVDEAYREDELKKFASRYGRWIILAVGLILAAVGATLFWQSEQTRKVETISEQFSEALNKTESGATTEAAEQLDAIMEGGNPAYKALAAFTRAGIAMNGGNRDEALALYRGVADDKAAPKALRDAATLKLVRLEFDTVEPAEILKRMAPYIEGDSPWFPIAGETAALAHLKAGDRDKAGALFLRIASDARAPASLRARAEQMAAGLGQDVSRLAEQLAKAGEDAADANMATAQDAAAPAAEVETGE